VENKCINDPHIEVQELAGRPAARLLKIMSRYKKERNKGLNKWHPPLIYL